MQRAGLLLSLLLLTGCESLAYYSQAMQGQWSLWRQRHSIDQLLSDRSTDPDLKQRLLQVQAIRQFASKQLLLPENQSYSYYTDIDRSHVVWNVFAAEKFSVVPKTWCFPIAGCVNYRGYFSERAARNYATKLAAQGYDTYVGGVAAYSTLGWFADPVLNTFIDYDELSLAGLIFHELAHQQVYVSGDTRFNESFASAVEMAGVERWLAATARSEMISGYSLNRAMSRDFIAVTLQLREQLAQLYAQAGPHSRSESWLLSAKRQLIDDYQSKHYPAFKQRWSKLVSVESLDRYDHWASDSLNNAKLVTIASYFQWQPGFDRILAEVDGDWGLFYQRVKQIARQDAAQRQRLLDKLSESR